ncbi:MAG: hypothetical protein H6713_15835 [Myxococcales bacterium]|nr:hypothetical protein [Myxococcales bacterium]
MARRPLDAPTITLTRAPPGLKQELRDRLWSLRGCYAQGLALDHRGRGRVTFEATAGGEHVDWVSATGHGFYQMAILECMQSRILEWRFADAFTGEFDFTVRLAPGSAGDLHRRLRASPGRPPLPVAALDGDYERVTRRLLDRDDAGALADARRWWRAAPRDLLAALALGQAAEARGELELAGRAYGSLVGFAPTRDMAVRTAAGLPRAHREARPRAPPARSTSARSPATGATPAAARGRDAASRTRGSAPAICPARSSTRARALEATPPRGDARALHQTITEELALVATAWAAAAPEDPRPRDALRRHALDARPAATTLVALTWESTGVDLDLHIWDDDDRYASFREPWLGPPQARGGSFLVSDDADGRGPELFIGHATPRLDLVVHAYAKPPDGVVYGGVSILRLDARARLTAEWRPFVITRPGGVLGLGHIAPNPSAGAHAGEAAPAPADPATR